MPYYVQLDSNSIVQTVCELAGDDFASSTIIKIDSMDLDLLGQKYDPLTGFSPVPEK